MINFELQTSNRKMADAGNFRFVLHKWDSSSKEQQKHICPCCGRRSLVLYIDTLTGEPVDSNVGRCDHQQSCGYHKSPSQFFHETGKSPASPDSFTRVSRKVEEKPASIMDYSYVARSVAQVEKADLYKWLCRRFGEKYVEKIAKYYRLGYSNYFHNAVVFWQIDAQGNVRTGKVMEYNPETGHRIKEPKAKVMFSHRLITDKKEKDNFHLVQCFFGEHLVPHASGKICIVESEKTALIAAICTHGCTWIASGGLYNLNADKCKFLDGYDIVLFPDLGGEELWEQQVRKVPALKDALVSRWYRNHATQEDIDKGYDIGDYLVSEKDGWKELQNYLDSLD